MAEKEQKIGFIITHAAEAPELVTLAFSLINGALAMDVEPVIILQADGVWIGTKGYADQIHVEGMTHLKGLLDHVLKAGIEILVCGPCLKSRGIKEEDLIAQTIVGGGGRVVEALLECVNVVRY